MLRVKPCKIIDSSLMCNIQLQTMQLNMHAICDNIPNRVVVLDRLKDVDQMIEIVGRRQRSVLLLHLQTVE